jgi:hypothetical protein
MTRVASTPRPMTSASRKRACFSDRPVRNVLLAAASLAVVAAVTLFVLGAGQPTTVSSDLTSYSMSGHSVIINGHITNASHHAVLGANVVIYRVADGREKVLAHVATSPKGLCRVVLNRLPQSVLYVQVTKWLHGSHYMKTLRFWARPGRAYDVSAWLSHRSWVFFLPVLSY